MSNMTDIQEGATEAPKKQKLAQRMPPSLIGSYFSMSTPRTTNGIFQKIERIPKAQVAATSPSQPIPKCAFCKDSGHLVETCPAKASAIAKAHANKICNRCKVKGHIAINCSTQCSQCKKIGHTHKNCAQNTSCNYCKSLDHRIGDCPKICATCHYANRHAEDCPAFCKYCRATDHNVVDCPKRCRVCNKLGHYTAKCRDKPTSVKICSQCKKEGHLKYECPKQKCTECNTEGHGKSQCPYIALSTLRDVCEQMDHDSEDEFWELWPILSIWWTCGNGFLQRLRFFWSMPKE